MFGAKACDFRGGLIVGKPCSDWDRYERPKTTRPPKDKEKEFITKEEMEI